MRLFGNAQREQYDEIHMEIRIHLPRPWILISIVIVLILLWSGIITIHNPLGSVLQEGEGGSTHSIVDTTKDIDRERVKQAVLERREEILRYQVQVLEEQALREKNPDDIDRLASARITLLAIIRERTTSEKLLLLSLQQLWEAEGSSYTLRGIESDTKILLPISPRLGISAHFEDADYVKRFGFAHHAIDIPTAKGTVIQAPADGTVLKVALNGLGYSYVTIEHAGGMQTIYGHISKALVQEGDTVATGDEIAETGGVPGEEGTGLYSTGPHLHFAVRIKGVLVDPLQYLPKI